MKQEKIDPERLGKDLAHYGSLDKIIQVKEARAETLRHEVDKLQSDVARLQGESSRLKQEVEELRVEKTNLLDENRELGEQKQALSQSIGLLRNRKKGLENRIPPLEGAICALEAKRTGLDTELQKLERKIQEKEEKLIVIPTLDNEIEEKAKHLQDLEGKISDAGYRYRLFEGFAGFVSTTQESEIQEFLDEIPGFIKDIRKGGYDPEFLKKYIIDKLTWDSLKVFSCVNCGVRWVILRRYSVQDSVGYRMYDVGLTNCIFCGNMWSVECEKDLTKILEEELDQQSGIVDSQGHKWIPIGKLNKK